MTVTTRTGRTLACIALVAITLLMLSGCGRKGWPEPQVMSQSFDYRDIYANTEAECVTITAIFRGEYDNLSRIVLELEETDVDSECQGCPFHADQRIEYTAEMENIVLRGPKLILSHCGLVPGQSYRWRLITYNAHEALNPVVSRIGTITP